MLAVAAILIGCALIVIALILNAEEGWQDADGYHAGPAPPWIEDGNGVPIERIYHPRAGHSQSDRLADPFTVHAQSDSPEAKHNHVG